MGLMYWQINDIWQAPTWATIEYGLKWKMAHYYVQHMYESVYPLVILTPYLANVTDENARISIHMINDLFNEVHGQLICSVYTLDTFSIRLAAAFDVSLGFATLQHVIDIPYSKLMKRAQCSEENSCLMHCSFTYDDQKIEQTLFLTRPKNYQLYQPNLAIQDIQQVSSREIRITITATRPALFVWLDLSTKQTGYFSQNGFHMFEPTKTVSFYSWTSISDYQIVHSDWRVTSLFDVTQS